MSTKTFKDLQTAILNKDPNAVVEILTTWDHEERKRQIEPFNLLMMALGRRYDVVGPCDLTLDHPDVEAKRKSDGLVVMSDKDGTWDYDVVTVAELASFGLSTAVEVPRVSIPDKHIAAAARIVADRRPIWWDKWYADATVETQTLRAEIGADFWVSLYALGVVPAEDCDRVKDRLSADLPHAMESTPHQAKKVLRDIEAARDLIYRLPQEKSEVCYADHWEATFAFLREEGLLDASRLLEAVFNAINKYTSQSDRNGCLLYAKAAHADAKTMAMHESQLLAMVADDQASVAGYAVQQLKTIQDAGLLKNAKTAIGALPSVFFHKPKTHAKTAVEMLAKIAEDEKLRSPAVSAIVNALAHPNKDVQKAALAAIETHLRPEDEVAIDSIGRSKDTIAKTLIKDLERILQFDAATSKPPAEQLGEEMTPLDVSTFQESAKKIPATVRTLLRIDEALKAAETATIDHRCPWSIQDMRILASAEPIQPIETVEELIDVAYAAVEKCECADTADRIIGGIMRLYRERSKSFEAMTKSMRKRTYANIWDRVPRGIVGGSFGASLSLLIGAWLGVEPDEDAYVHTSGPIELFVAELSRQVKAGTAQPLLSEATHSGGWIDPTIWVQRMIDAQADGRELIEDDLVRSLLRLTPDGRKESLQLCTSLQMPLRALAETALGGEVKLDESYKPQVWITALRARDAWIDLSQELSDDELAALPEKLKKLPDVIYPSDYQWRAKERIGNSSSQDLVESWPTRTELADMLPNTGNTKKLLSLLLDGSPTRDGLEEEFLQLAAQGRRKKDNYGFLTVALHHTRFYCAPAFAYPYMAHQWPMKLDWYWSVAATALSRRVESGASVEEPYGYFLLPLLQTDRPITTMAARALWIATVSKDGNARSMAVETWIALIESDRTDLPILIETLFEVMAGGWVKVNRIGEIFTEVAAASPLHAWTVASLLETFLTRCNPLPRNVATMLELLDECCQQLGRAISGELKESLQSIKSGKAKSAAKSLLERSDQITPDRAAAVAAAMNARFARAERVNV